MWQKVSFEPWLWFRHRRLFLIRSDWCLLKSVSGSITDRPTLQRHISYVTSSCIINRLQSINQPTQPFSRSQVCAVSSGLSFRFLLCWNTLKSLMNYSGKRLSELIFWDDFCVKNSAIKFWFLVVWVTYSAHSMFTDRPIRCQVFSTWKNILTVNISRKLPQITCS